jgi:hypothetical protein
MLGMRLDTSPTPDPKQVTFGEGADKLAAHCYCPIWLRWGQHNNVDIPWRLRRYVFTSAADASGAGDFGISILTGVIPHEQLTVATARASWLVAIRVITTSKHVAKATDKLMSERFAKRPAVRRTTGTHDRLYGFTLGGDGEQWPFQGSMSPRLFAFPKEASKYFGLDGFSECRVLSAAESFAYSGYCCARTPAASTSDTDRGFYWERDLMEVPVADLPSLTEDAAWALQKDIETIFESHGAERV